MDKTDRTQLYDQASLPRLILTSIIKPIFQMKKLRSPKIKPHAQITGQRSPTFALRAPPAEPDSLHTHPAPSPHPAPPQGGGKVLTGLRLAQGAPYLPPPAGAALSGSSLLEKRRRRESGLTHAHQSSRSAFCAGGGTWGFPSPLPACK